MCSRVKQIVRPERKNMSSYEDTKEKWIEVFNKVPIQDPEKTQYAVLLADEDIDLDVLLTFDENYVTSTLHDLKVKRGHIMKLLLYMKEKRKQDEAVAGSNGELNTSNSSNDSSGQPKKKSKVNEFIEESKNAASIIEVVGKASAVIECLEKDNQQLEAQCACQEFQLDGRGTIEYCESQIFPQWIKNIKMERYQQWALSLDFELTPMARTLRKKIPAVLSGHDVGKIVDSFYNTWAIKYTHKRRIRPPRTDLWALIFKSLNVSQAEERSVLKSIILMNVLEAKPLDGGENTTSGYMIIDNVSWFVTREKIIDFCTKEGVQVLKLSFILDNTDRKTSKIGIFVSDIHIARKMLPNVPNHLHAPGRKWEEIISVLQNEI